MKKQVAKRAALYLIVGLITLEVAARIDDWIRESAPLLGTYSIDSLFQSAPDGRAGRPGARFGKWKMNSLGFRGPEPTPGRPSILALGASETFGMYEPDGEEYPRQLEAVLNRDGPAFNVVNGAIPGMRIGRAKYLQMVLDIVKPKIVVIYPSPASYIGIEQAYCGRDLAPVPETVPLIGHVRLVAKVQALVKKVLPTRAADWLRSVMLKAQSRGIQVSETAKKEWLVAFAIDLDCAVKVARQAGAEPILVTHATYFGREFHTEDSALMVSWRLFYPDLTAAGMLDMESRANEVVREIGVRDRLTVVDAAREIPAGSEYFGDFVHFTVKGAERMSALIAPPVRRLLANQASVTD